MIDVTIRNNNNTTTVRKQMAVAEHLASLLPESIWKDYNTTLRVYFHDNAQIEDFGLENVFFLEHDDSGYSWADIKQKLKSTFRQQNQDTSLDDIEFAFVPSTKMVYNQDKEDYEDEKDYTLMFYYHK